MRVIGIVTARMGSTRVPGKSMLPINNVPLIIHVLNLVKKIGRIDQICLATSNLTIDNVLEEAAVSIGIPVFRGSPENVLDRIYECARTFSADVVIDVGGDCPLLDPAVIEQALTEYLLSPCDYMCNYDPPTFPEGLDINICSMEALRLAYERAIAPSQRIHPFSYITVHHEDFDIKNYTMIPDLSELHWSVDFPEDVKFVTQVYSRLSEKGQEVSIKNILDLTMVDNTIRILNDGLKRPKVTHAFWNSPGIINDMNNDISAMCDSAKQAIKDKDYTVASKFYKEISYIARELWNGSK